MVWEKNLPIKKKYFRIKKKQELKPHNWGNFFVFFEEQVKYLKIGF